METIFLAIDPGWSGAVAVQTPKTLMVYNCPENVYEILDLVRDIRRICINEAGGDVQFKAMLENVHSMPNMSCTTVWVFAMNYSCWQTCLYCCGIPTVEVTPQKWMKAFASLPKDKAERKRKIKAKVKQLYPNLKVSLKNADALAMLSVVRKFVG